MKRNLKQLPFAALVEAAINGLDQRILRTRAQLRILEAQKAAISGAIPKAYVKRKLVMLPDFQVVKLGVANPAEKKVRDELQASQLEKSLAIRMYVQLRRMAKAEGRF